VEDVSDQTLVYVGSVENTSLNLVFLSLCTGLRGIWLTSKQSWIADFVAARREFYFSMHSLTAFLPLCTGLRGICLLRNDLDLHFVVAVYGAPGNLIYFETTLDCIFCRCTQCSGAFFSLRNDIGLHILSLHTVLLGILLTSKRSWIADFVAVHATPVQFAYFETTLDCRFCRCTRCSGAFSSLREDLGLQILSLCTGLQGILITSKRRWIADFVAAHETPGHLACFETTLDCRFCRCTRDAGAFGLLRNDPGL
jgi:hypothetical protein